MSRRTGFAKTVKDFFTKENFDFDSPDIDLYNFHPQLRIFLAIKGIFFNNRTSLLKLMWPSYCMLVILTDLVFTGMFTHHGLTTGDYSFATENLCYFMILWALPLIYTSLLFNTNKIHELVEDMNQNFIHICSLGSKYRSSFLGGQLLIWKLCYAWLSYAGLIGCLNIATPLVLLIYQTLFMTQDEHTVRPLSFPAWLPNDDPYRTPNYEFFFVLQMNVSYVVFQTFCGYVYILFHLFLHYYYVLDMIMLDFEVLFDELDESVVNLPRHDPRRKEVQRVLNGRMKRIVTWHLGVLKAVKRISSIFGPTLVYQVMFSAILICLFAYEIADRLENGNINIPFTMLGIGAVIQLWIPCYLGTLLRNKVMSSAYSYFNMLRQYCQSDI